MIPITRFGRKFQIAWRFWFCTIIWLADISGKFKWECKESIQNTCQLTVKSLILNQIWLHVLASLFNRKIALSEHHSQLLCFIIRKVSWAWLVWIDSPRIIEKIFFFLSYRLMSRVSESVFWNLHIYRKFCLPTPVFIPDPPENEYQARVTY